MRKPRARPRTLSPRSAWRIAGASAAALLLETVFVCCLGFAPGWANGWPGASKHTGFATLMALALLLTRALAGAAALAPPCAYGGRAAGRLTAGWRAFVVSLLAWVAASAVLPWRSYPEIRSS